MLLSLSAVLEGLQLKALHAAHARVQNDIHKVVFTSACCVNKFADAHSRLFNNSSISVRFY